MVGTGSDFRMFVGAIQFVIGVGMIRLYRRCGVWAMGRSRMALP